VETVVGGGTVSTMPVTSSDSSWDCRDCDGEFASKFRRFFDSTRPIEKNIEILVKEKENLITFLTFGSGFA
jgi:hypothetical protein